MAILSSLSSCSSWQTFPLEGNQRLYTLTEAHRAAALLSSVPAPLGAKSWGCLISQQQFLPSPSLTQLGFRWVDTQNMALRVHLSIAWLTLAIGMDVGKRIVLLYIITSFIYKLHLWVWALNWSIMFKYFSAPEEPDLVRRLQPPFKLTARCRVTRKSEQAHQGNAVSTSAKHQRDHLMS